PAIERPGAVVLDQHVEARQQPLEELLALGLAQVERYRALVAVHRFPQQRLAVLVRRQRAQRIAAARQLRLDHVGAEIGEQRGGEWSCNDVRDVEDAQSFERAHLQPSPSPASRSICAAENPQSASAARPPSPRSGGARRTPPGVREYRGAAAGCSTPATVTKFARATLCGSSLASENVNTGAKHASEPSNTAHHSARVFDLNTFVKRSRSTGQPLRSCCCGSVSPASPRRSSSST